MLVTLSGMVMDVRLLQSRFPLCPPLLKVFRFSLQLILCMGDNLIFRMDKKFKYIIIYIIIYLHIQLPPFTYS